MKCFVPLLWIVMLAAPSAEALTLWSTPESYLGTGKFFGPGANTVDQDLFPVRIHNMIFITERDFVTPFVNNGGAPPNTCAEEQFRGEVDGKLSDGRLINENVSTCVMTVAGTQLLPAVVAGGAHQGQQVSVTLETGDVVMTMDLAIDMGIGPRGVILLPFYGTTGSLVVPRSLQGEAGGRGVDQAGVLLSGTVITGRIGDFNHDGWIDGTLVAVGNMPLDSPIYPGQPYAMYRNFETDVPIAGAIFGNVAGLHEAIGNGEPGRVRR